MPVFSGRGSADELLAFQRLAWSSLVLSVTRQCPLRCAHCITSSGPDVHGSTLTAAQALRWAAELPALAEAGLRHLTFTGGEPVLAIDAVSTLAAAARPLGIRTAIVTSGAWATTAATARRVVARLQPIAHWDLGYDEFHEAQMEWERLVHAVEALDEAEASFSVRVCVRENSERSEHNASSDAIVQRVSALLGPDRTVMRQPVRHLGRAEAWQGDAKTPRPRQPCPSSGAFVREDGQVGPCCSGLAYEPAERHPFNYGNAHTGSLLDSWLTWRRDQLLRLMRLVGVGVLQQWLDDAGAPVADVAPADPCETCVALWRSATPDITRRVLARGDDPAIRTKLDELERHLFGSVL